MFLITSTLGYIFFTKIIKNIGLPLKKKYINEKMYLNIKQIHNITMSIISAYMFLSGFKVYNEVKTLTNSDSIYTNIYSPLKTETETFKHLLPVILYSKYNIL